MMAPRLGASVRGCFAAACPGMATTGGAGVRKGMSHMEKMKKHLPVQHPLLPCIFRVWPSMIHLSFLLASLAQMLLSLFCPGCGCNAGLGFWKTCLK